MRDARIAQLKNQLSRYLALVRKGEVIRILDRDVPVAKLVPIHPASAGGVGGEALVEMERKGLVRRATRRIPREILEKDPPGKPAGVLQALLEGRRTR